MHCLYSAALIYLPCEELYNPRSHTLDKTDNCLSDQFLRFGAGDPATRVNTVLDCLDAVDWPHCVKIHGFLTG